MNPSTERKRKPRPATQGLVHAHFARDRAADVVAVVLRGPQRVPDRATIA
jgi:hypothetical protein